MDFITLKNKDKSKLVQDVLMHPLRVNKDASGLLVETLRVDWKDIYGMNREFAMQYYSITPSGVARDENVWHCHLMQEDRFLVVSGTVVTVIADNRKNSPTKGLLNLFYMEANIDPYILLIPKKTLHGFMVASKTPAILLNYPTQLYNPKDEVRIPYLDVNIKIGNGSLFSWQSVRKKLTQPPSL